eukprot:SAG31_NODE_847_length_11532_cov_2.297560_7_plen_294_part_00
MTNLDIDGLLSPQFLSQWKLLYSTQAVVLLAPGVLGGVALLVLTNRYQHYLTLPLCLVAMPLIFYFITLVVAGLTMDQLRTNGWVSQETSPFAFYECWELFSAQIHWSAIIDIIPTWLAMVFVVAFSSCLDVAAISLDIGTPLDYDHELKVVGSSNCVSGLLGGYTGSYIFSLTIFNLRQGRQLAASTNDEGLASTTEANTTAAQSVPDRASHENGTTGTPSVGRPTERIAGLVIIIAEVIVFVLPWSVSAYLPHFFFGAVLAFIAFDLMVRLLLLMHATVSHQCTGLISAAA